MRDFYSRTERWIIDYLEGKGWTRPTEIGKAYGIYLHGEHHHYSCYHSAWASPKCKKLVANGDLERNGKGHYRVNMG